MYIDKTLFPLQFFSTDLLINAEHSIFGNIKQLVS